MHSLTESAPFFYARYSPKGKMLKQFFSVGECTQHSYLSCQFIIGDGYFSELLVLILANTELSGDVIALLSFLSFTSQAYISTNNGDKRFPRAGCCISLVLFQWNIWQIVLMVTGLLYGGWDASVVTAFRTTCTWYCGQGSVCHKLKC